MIYSKSFVSELLECFGLPLYVFDEGGFRDNYLHLQSSMRSGYSQYHIAYSFKTNYTPYICRTAKDMGAYAEVVSGMEYEIAKRIGYEDPYIIFNGPEKGEEGIFAFLNGAVVNADSVDELKIFCRTAAQYPERNFRIGLRINLDLGQDFISRFGMDQEDVRTAFQIAGEIDNLTISGLHCHISRCRSLEAWRKRTEIMLALADRYFSDAPEYIDLGSGMFGSMAPEFARQFDAVPSYEEYARVTAGLISKHYEGKKGPLLFTEPGTTLVNRFVDCITKVETIKRIGSHFFAVLSCSEHILGETCTLKKLPVIVIPGGGEQVDYECIDLTGYTCLEQDIMYREFKGKIAEGDYVIFGNTGGYSNVLKPPFIRPGCAMAARKPDGSFCLIKAAETYEDILKTYIF